MFSLSCFTSACQCCITTWQTPISKTFSNDHQYVYSPRHMCSRAAYTPPPTQCHNLHSDVTVFEAFPATRTHRPNTPPTDTRPWQSSVFTLPDSTIPLRIAPLTTHILSPLYIPCTSCALALSHCTSTCLHNESKHCHTPKYSKPLHNQAQEHLSTAPLKRNAYPFPTSVNSRYGVLVHL